MRNFVRAISLALFVAIPASQAAAQSRIPTFKKTYNSYAVDAKVLNSKPVYKAGEPVFHRVCEDVEVPIYQAGDPANQVGNTVAGVVIGGVLGKALTGNNNGATAGAIIGGIAGANKDNRRIVGYRIERQCETVQDSTSKIKYYKSRIRIEGRVYRTQTSFPLNAGETIRMYMPN